MEAIVVHDSKKIYQVNDVALNLMKLDDKNQLVGKACLILYLKNLLN